MMAGMYIRPLTTANVEKHLEDVGLDREVRRRGLIRG